MKPIALALLALTACAALPDAVPERPVIDRAAVTAAALVAWESRFDNVPQCWAVAGSINWVTFDGPAFFAACKTHYHNACTKLQVGGVSIVLRGDAAYTREQMRVIYAHELAHWLISCSGRQRDGDPGHRLSQVWDLQVNETIRALEKLPVMQ